MWLPLPLLAIGPEVYARIRSFNCMLYCFGYSYGPYWGKFAKESARIGFDNSWCYCRSPVIIFGARGGSNVAYGAYCIWIYTRTMDLVEPGCSHQAEVTSATTPEVNVSRKRHFRGREGILFFFGGRGSGAPPSQEISNGLREQIQACLQQDWCSGTGDTATVLTV